MSFGSISTRTFTLPIMGRTSVGRKQNGESFKAFANPTMGGITLALPHGSIFLEIAKAEFQAQAV